ncbi:MAG: phosphatidate cytidylyltransferase [Eubacteriaceae bacterium]
MSKRVWTAVFGIPLLIMMLVFGKGFLTVGVSLLSLVGIMEYTKAANRVIRPKIKPLMMAALSMVVTVTIRLDYYFLMPMLLILLMLIFCNEILSGNTGIQRGSAVFFGLVYVSVMFGYLFLFENIQHGIYYVWMIFIIAFGTDTAAYFVGKNFGKTKLAPKISPKKTIAGAVGGLMTSGIVMIIYGMILGQFFDFVLPWYFYLAIGVLASFAGQCGDLTASMIKRSAHIKDFGYALPGHGGILDRFDSILFIIPLIYIFASLTIGLA